MLGCNRKTNYTRSSDTRESYPPSDSSRSIAFNSLLKENVDERKFTTERRENVSLKIAAQPKASCIRPQ